MKYLLIILFYLNSLAGFGQEDTNSFDPHTWKAPYYLPVPENWTIERFLIPISFAPKIPYRGIEDIRFPPGWAKVKSDEYWSYAFLWYVDSVQKTTAKIIENNLKTYYAGLIEANTASLDIPADQLVAVKTKIKKTKKSKGDVKTFRGTIYMLDYMQKKPITLNCIVHLKSCSGQNKTFLFYEISPKAFNETIWQTLDQLWSDFSCDKAS